MLVASWQERLIQGKRAAVETLYRTKGADTAGFTLDELKHLTGVVRLLCCSYKRICSTAPCSHHGPP